MQEVDSLVKTTMGEIEKLLTYKTVVGDPINIDGKTLIPLVSVGFGFGAGGGTGKAAQKQQQEGTGGGTGGPLDGCHCQRRERRQNRGY